MNSSQSQKDYAIREMSPSRMKAKLTGWVIIWPISFIENIAGDIINTIQTAIMKVFRGIFQRIYSAGVSRLTGTV